MKNKLLTILSTVSLCLFLIASTSFSGSSSKNSVLLYFFWGDGCPHCAKEKEFLSVLKKKYPQLEIKDYEVWYNLASRQLLLTMSKSYNINPSGVPVTFIGDKAFIGFSEKTASQIEETLKYCLKNTCKDPLYYKK